MSLIDPKVGQRYKRSPALSFSNIPPKKDILNIIKVDQGVITFIWEYNRGTYSNFLKDIYNPDEWELIVEIEGFEL